MRRRDIFRKISPTPFPAKRAGLGYMFPHHTTTFFLAKHRIDVMHHSCNAGAAHRTNMLHQKEKYIERNLAYEAMAHAKARLFRL
jgi:hypothetical protein